MVTTNYLRLSRHNIYVYRRRIPIAISHFFHSNEIRLSTHTRNKKLANHISRQLTIESDRLFLVLLQSKNMAVDENIKKNILLLTQHWKEKHALRTQLEKSNDLNIELIRNFNRERDATKQAHLENLTIQADTFKLAVSQLSDNTKRNIDKPKVKLSTLIEDFLSPAAIERRKDKLSTVRKNKDALTLFMEIIGDKVASEINQADAAKFSREIITHKSRGGKRASSTVNGFISSVSKFSEWLEAFHSETGHIKLNFKSLRVKNDKRPSEERALITDSDFEKIITSQQFIDYKNNNKSEFWVLVIAAYSGMRLEEISQLNPLEDIYINEQGIWIFDINSRDYKNTKTDTSPRKIPIHSKLLEYGIVSYVQYLKEIKAPYFCHSETIGKEGRIGKNIGKRLSRFMQYNIGLTGKSLHSFRHSVATKLKHANVEEGIAAALIGHAHGGITYTRYGKDYESVTLQSALEKIYY